MKTEEILHALGNYPFFTINHLIRLAGKKPEYLKVLLYRLQQRKRIVKIERSKYTIHDDPMAFATQLLWPSYLSGWQALRYYNLTEQLPTIFEIFTPKKKKKKEIIFQNYKIRFRTVKPKFFFGFTKKKYKSFDFFVAYPEKAILDSAFHKSLSFSELSGIVKNHFAEFDRKKFLSYLIKFGNKAMIKRFGFLLEVLGHDYFPKCKKYIDKNYVKLDYLLPSQGKKNKKWRVIINT